MSATLSAWPSGIAGGRYHPTAAQEETRARLDYLVAARRRLGLLIGARGSGKTLALELAAQSWRKSLFGVSLQNATALEPHTFLWQLAADWHLQLPLQSPIASLWQAALDALAVHRCEERGSILLLDDAGIAKAEVLQLAARLTQAGDIGSTSLTIILAVDPARVNHLGEELLSRADLRVELSPLDVAETRDYLQARLPSEEKKRVRFDAAATERMHALTAGLPRRIDQLAELVMLAAASDGREEIDAALIETVYRELSAQSLRR